MFKKIFKTIGSKVSIFRINERLNKIDRLLNNRSENHAELKRKVKFNAEDIEKIRETMDKVFVDIADIKQNNTNIKKYNSSKDQQLVAINEKISVIKDNVIEKINSIESLIKDSTPILERALDLDNSLKKLEGYQEAIEKSATQSLRKIEDHTQELDNRAYMLKNGLDIQAASCVQKMHTLLREYQKNG